MYYVFVFDELLFNPIFEGGGPIPPKVFQKYQKKYNQQRAELVGLFRKIIYPKN